MSQTRHANLDVLKYTAVRKNATNQTLLQSALDAVKKWADDNSMLINATKSQLINLSLSELRQSETYSVENVNITECDTVKLLDVTIDKRFTFSKHLNDLTESLASRLYAMCQLKRLGL